MINIKTHKMVARKIECETQDRDRESERGNFSREKEKQFESVKRGWKK